MKIFCMYIGTMNDQKLIFFHSMRRLGVSCSLLFKSIPTASLLQGFGRIKLAQIYNNV